MKKLLLIPILLASCSSQGFHNKELRSATAMPAQINRPEIAQVLKQRAQLPNPFRLGVFFREPEIREGDEGIWARWTREEKDRIFASLKEIHSKEVSAVFPVIGAASNDLTAVRVAAARQGADAVLVISGASETVTNPNALALGYVLLAPMFFLHGTDVETLFYTRAALWDVKNEYLYMAAEGEATVKASRPFAAQAQREQFEKAKQEAITDLAKKLKEEAGEMLQASIRP